MTVLPRLPGQRGGKAIGDRQIVSTVSGLKRAAGRACGPLLEALENRQLFAVTVATPLPAVSVDPAASGSKAVDLSSAFTDPASTTVELTTSNGPVDIGLFDAAAPKTVANFLKYVSSGRYNNTIIHRAIPGFIVQGGGYTPTGTHIATFGNVPNEFSATRSNLRGTIAMAKLGGDPNSATSEWFFNLADNSANLDNQNGGFTVFGHVVNNTLSNVDAIAALPKADGSSLNSAFAPENGTTPILPVQSPVPPATLAASNLVTISAAAVVPDARSFTYTATSSDPSIATATVSGSSLAIGYGTTLGSANITVVATDSNGATATQTFAVGVGGLNVQVGAGFGKSVTYTDASGHKGTVSLSGPGSATIHFTGSGLTQTAAGKAARRRSPSPGPAWRPARSAPPARPAAPR